MQRRSTESNISMANEGFDHPCELVMRDGVGIVHLRAVMVYIQMRKETVTQSAFLRNVCNFLI